jgi:hypothetical protein
MQSLRVPFEAGLFWAPIVGALAFTALAGGQVRSPSAMPSSLSSAFFLCGVALILGAIVGIFEPARFRHWLRPTAGLAWRTMSQYLFALVFGGLLVVWALVAAFRHGL